MFARRCPGCTTRRGGLCHGCLKHFGGSTGFRVGATAGLALTEYNQFSQRVVLAAKNGGRPDVLKSLGRQLGVLWCKSMAYHGPTNGNANPGTVTVAWVPASRAGRRNRGYDQGRLLAKAAASEITRLPGSGGRVRAEALLTRADRHSQTGHSRLQRSVGPDLRWSGRDAPAAVVLIDDVVTTGSSLRAAVDVLNSNGVVRVDVLAVAAVS